MDYTTASNVENSIGNSFKIKQSQNFMSGKRVDPGNFMEGDYWKNQLNNLGSTFTFNVKIDDSESFGKTFKNELTSKIMSKIMENTSVQTLSEIMWMCGLDAEAIMNDEVKKDEVWPTVKETVQQKIEDIAYAAYNSSYKMMCRTIDKAYDLVQEVCDDCWVKIENAPIDYAKRLAYWTISYTKTPAEIRAELAKEKKSSKEIQTEEEKNNEKEFDERLKRVKDKIKNITKQVQDVENKISDVVTTVSTYWYNGPEYIEKYMEKATDIIINNLSSYVYEAEDFCFSYVDFGIDWVAMKSGGFIAKGINISEKWAIRKIDDCARQQKQKTVSEAIAKLRVAAALIQSTLGVIAGKAAAMALKIAADKIKIT